MIRYKKQLGQQWILFKYHIILKEAIKSLKTDCSKEMESLETMYSKTIKVSGRLELCHQQKYSDK